MSRWHKYDVCDYPNIPYISPKQMTATNIIFSHFELKYQRKGDFRLIIFRFWPSLAWPINFELDPGPAWSKSQNWFGPMSWPGHDFNGPFHSRAKIFWPKPIPNFLLQQKTVLFFSAQQIMIGLGQRVNRLSRHFFAPCLWHLRPCWRKNKHFALVLRYFCIAVNICKNVVWHYRIRAHNSLK